MIQHILLNLFKEIKSIKINNNSSGISSYNLTALRCEAICVCELPGFA